jgi:hypothetical protein
MPLTPAPRQTKNWSVAETLPPAVPTLSLPWT